MLSKKQSEIIKYGKMLYDKGLIAGFDGNLSIRYDKEHFLITASGVHKGMLNENHILLLDNHLNIISGSSKPSSEALLHKAIYGKCPEARAIIHAHAPYSTAASIVPHLPDLTRLVEGRLFFSKVPVVEDLLPGSRELADAAGRAAHNSRIIILKAHGVVAWGKTMLEAFGLVESLEHNFKILAIANGIFQE